MKVHHLDCGSLPFGLVSHCLLVETGTSLTLVDTGFGTNDVHDPERTLGWTRHVVRPRLDSAQTAVSQIKALGYAPEDVQDIVLTHLDYDHAGGLSDFPWARVHVHGPEYRTATAPSLIDQLRYRPVQWAHDPNWVINETGGDDWFGFEAVAPVPGLPAEIRIVPLYGHTAGHVGVAIESEGRWLLHAGDAFLADIQLNRMFPGLLLSGAAFGVASTKLAVSRIANMHRLADLVRRHRDHITVFSSHDPLAFARMVA
ncbi:MAG: MBL fold metallo-hydrolase [Rhodococcus sp.]|nr:MBL fold metallo-hydrolase [Rhodococcus sp. (in: high G+C Gram-positive bacteria)]